MTEDSGFRVSGLRIQWGYLHIEETALAHILMDSAVSANNRLLNPRLHSYVVCRGLPCVGPGLGFRV